MFFSVGEIVVTEKSGQWGKVHCYNEQTGNYHVKFSDNHQGFYGGYDLISRAQYIRRTLREIYNERSNQFEKWGLQDYPTVSQLMLDVGLDADAMCHFYNIPTEAYAKKLVENFSESKQLTYAHVAIEELSEAVSAASTRDIAATRKELVQLAAVILGWIETLDRNGL